MSRSLIADPVSMASTLIRRRALLLEVIRRELKLHRFGLLPGIVWRIGFPIFLLVFYIFLFSTIFAARNGPLGEGAVVYILAGLVPWLFTAEVLERASAAIVGGAGLVKHVLFPIEVLPISVIGAGMLSFALQVAILVLVSVFKGGLTWMLLMFVPLVVLHLACLVGLSLALATVGVYLRDLNDVIRVVLALGLFAAPILYPLASVPVWARIVLELNPFTHMVLCYQDVFYSRGFAHPWSWVAFAVFAVAAFVIGNGIMRRARMFLANFL